MTRDLQSTFKLGYSYSALREHDISAPLYAPNDSHMVVVGGSGSGKSTAMLYWLNNIRKREVSLYICDFKKSHEFEGITESYAEFEDCFSLIKEFYEDFLNTPEGGEDRTKILIIDEVAGLLTHLSMTKEGKGKADEVRQILSTILMLGRSRRCFLWLSMQRYTATIFPASSGAGDNFHVAVGLGRLTVDGRRGLFGGEELKDEESYQFGQGSGLLLMDGKPLKALILPRLSKKSLLGTLRAQHRYHLSMSSKLTQSSITAGGGEASSVGVPEA